MPQDLETARTTQPSEGGRASRPLRFDRLVVMGVSGCGKSTLAQALADTLGWRMIEGDSYHSPASIVKIRDGVALTDDDRREWLATLAGLLAVPQPPAVLACSALRHSYRDRLRAGAPGRVGFVFMALTLEEAYARVARRKGHNFPASLVSSQFDTLEAPLEEADVLVVDASAPLEQNVAEARQWLALPQT